MAEEQVEGSGHARFSYLLISLLSIFFLYPVVERLGRGTLFGIFYSVVLLAAVYVISERKHSFLLALLMATPAILTRWVGIVSGDPIFLLLGSVFGVLFLSFTAGSIISHVLKAERVTAQKIYGAICAYLLFGMIWVSVYSIIEFFIPGSFRMGEQNHLSQSDMFYYSFITLTTLGYGDLVPLSAMARSMAALEALTGQLYLAVLVARLVGLHITHSSD